MVKSLVIRREILPQMEAIASHGGQMASLRLGDDKVL
jgi:hypothetical protein